jgi:hypothetical protein
MEETGWVRTRHGGLRRTEVAQKTGTQALETSDGAETVANVEAEAFATPGSTSEEHAPDKGEVGGSNPSLRTKKFAVKFGERLGLPTCPYVVRWRVETPWGSVRVHHWLAPDDDRAPHDHPWGFRTFVLKGGYVDRSPDGDEYLRAPATRYRPATHQHTVFPDPGGCWTIIVTGPKVRNWGFWVKGKFVKMNKYFLTYGHHPCD